MSDGPPRGHVKLARKAFDATHGDPFWLEARTYSRFEAWLDLLQLATWRKRSVATRKFGLIELDRGDVLLAVRSVATRWGWDKNAAHAFLKLLTNSGRLAVRSSGRWGTVYAIVKYDAYQSSDREVGTLDGTLIQTETGRKRDKKEAVKHLTTPSDAPRPADNWVSRLAHRFREGGGSVRDGHLGRELKPAHERFGETILGAAIDLWLSERKSNGWSCAFGKFAADHVQWCERAKELYQSGLSGVDYWDNPALQLLTRPSLVA